MLHIKVMCFLSISSGDAAWTASVRVLLWAEIDARWRNPGYCVYQEWHKTCYGLVGAKKTKKETPSLLVYPYAAHHP